jgi:hypothetical protein
MALRAIRREEGGRRKGRRNNREKKVFENLNGAPNNN